ncbi:MAG: protein-L-isoaspartate(D-aspartate) O-methyltransferase, partial [Terriglobia bacterium]
MTRNRKTTLAAAALAGLLLASCQTPFAQNQDWARQREAMVRETIAQPRDARDPVRDPRVLDAMRRVPRHEFVSPESRSLAYGDYPLSIGLGQTISQPYIVAKMTELLKPQPDDRVLEVGTGSGYQAAVLAELVKEVYTIEIVAPLAAQARRRLERLGYKNIHTRTGDGYLGWPGAAPFDSIIVTAAATHLPPPLLEQLKPGGRLVIPAGGSPAVQELLVVHRGQTAKDIRIERIM